MKKHKTPYLLLVILAALSITACSQSTSSPKENDSSQTSVKTTGEATNENEDTKKPTVTEKAVPKKERITDKVNKLPNIEITSSSLLKNGKWLSIITKSKGENKSPQLSWTPVKNAAYYAIYMFDTSAGNWLHWIVKDLTVTELDLGAKIENSQYVGPYPPDGTHTYEITVYALAATPDLYIGAFDAANYITDKVIEELDTANGKSGNIIAKGVISGTYTAGKIVK